ncbi:integral membrane sensor signal transduction histidine kinase, partial [gut metagenome]
DIVTVEDELENVKSYMEIQQIRNKDLFSYEVDCRVDAQNTWVLKLILQPLVENSIKYGFCNIFEGGRIRIEIFKDKEMLCLRVYNSGAPIDKEKVELIQRMNEMPVSALKECFPDKTHGYGVMNIMTRLRLKYGDQVRFFYVAEEEGTTCTIQIPGGGQP